VSLLTYGNGIVHTLSQNDRQLPDTSCDFYGALCGASATLKENRGQSTFSDPTRVDVR
jgi:hypothetical protein